MKIHAATKPVPSDKDDGYRKAAPKQLNSEVLFDDTDIVLIHHKGDTYLLRKTRHGKLILTK
jgi:hemin uptake protein HemP